MGASLAHSKNRPWTPATCFVQYSLFLHSCRQPAGTHDACRLQNTFYRPTAPIPVPLESGEHVLATFTPNLDDQRHFQGSVLLLTNRRLIYSPHQGQPATWPLASDLRLDATVLGGLGKLKLSQNDSLISQWWFTAALNAQVDRFAGAFHIAIRAHDLSGIVSEPQTCPSCGFVLSSEDPVCPSCTPVAAPPATHSLRRLFPFARRRASTILSGLLLAIAATIAGLVPPYLSIPLMDNVLVPMRAGSSVPSGLVTWYLGLLAVSAVAAGCWVGPRHSYFRWPANKSARTCGWRPTSTCSGCRWSFTVAGARAI